MEWPSLPSSPFTPNYCASPRKTRAPLPGAFPVIMLLSTASFFFSVLTEVLFLLYNSSVQNMRKCVRLFFPSLTAVV